MMKGVISFLALFLLVSTKANENCNLGQYAKGNQVFSVNVFKDLIKTEKSNVILSPLSARLVLGLTAEGAKGDTLTELSKGLQLSGSKEENHKSVSAVAQQFNKSNEHVKLLAANRLFVNHGFKIEKIFEEIAVGVYRSGIQNVDFTKPAQAASTVNNWVEERTNHRIKNLVSADQLSGIQLVLVNALYFSGKWVRPFQTQLTTQESFFGTNGQKKVDMMNGNIRTNYAHSDKLKAKFLKLAFQDTSVTMTFILPDDKEGLPHVEENLGEYLAPQDFKEVEVAISMPKFTIETKIDFIPILRKLGINKLFEPRDADLTGISKDGGLYVSFVVQKAYINVTESGAEAAAATAVGIAEITSILGPPPILYAFRADHPYIYYLQDEQTGTTLFIGKYVKVM